MPKETSRPTKIIRAPRHGSKPSDIENEDCWNVILHIRPTAETIKLNLEIIATEGENGYQLLLKDSKAHRLKESSSEQTDEEWKSVLRAVLLADPEYGDETWIPKLELSANVKNGKIELAILETVSSIKRKLGTLSIPQSDDTEVELWPWLSTATREKETTITKLRQAETLAKTLQDENERLSKQIESFIEAKEESERQLFVRFTSLLNEKKKKLRDVLRANGLGGEALDVPSTSRRRTPGTTTSATAASHSTDDEDSDDSFAGGTSSTTAKHKTSHAHLKRKASKAAEELEQEDKDADDDDDDDATQSDPDSVMEERMQATPDESEDEEEALEKQERKSKSKGKGKGKAKHDNDEKEEEVKEDKSSPPATRSHDKKIKQEEEEEDVEMEDSHTLGRGDDETDDDEL